MNDPRSCCPEKCLRLTMSIESPKLGGVGPKDANIMLVGEAPGQEEDIQGVPFIGRSGAILNDIFEEIGLNRDEIYITNAVKCATPVENQKPAQKDISSCRQYLIEEINTVKPNVIGVLGAVPLNSVLKRNGILKLQNNVFYSEEFKTKVIPMIHPAYVLRNPSMYTNLRKGLTLVKTEGIKKQKVETAKTKTRHIDADTSQKIDKVLSALEQTKSFTFDLETTSLNPIKAKIILIALSWKEGLGVTIKWDRLNKEQLNRLKTILLSKKEKIGHNLKFDIQVLRANGIKVKGPYFDTLLAISLINENMKDKGLDALTLYYLDLGEYWEPLDRFKAESIKEKKIKIKEFTYDMLPYKILCKYAQCDADATHRLYFKFKKELKRQNLIEFYKKYTIPTFKLLLNTEYKGIKINRKKLLKLIKKQKQLVKEAQKAIETNKNVKKYQKIRYAQVANTLEEKWKKSKTLRSRFNTSEDYVKTRIKEKDWKFNPGSPKQLQEMFFHMMKLPILKKTIKGQISTDNDVLTLLAEQHKIPLAQQITENRKLTKFLKTYLESVYEKSEIDGRIHPNYLQHRAVTGRLSSVNPNFQNIPRDANAFKKCFLADPGMVIVKADLAQAEFRCWAHYSKDQKMIKDIEAGLDIHRKMASEVFGVTEEDVTKDQRTAAKSAVFGLMYGRGSKAIAEQYGISVEDAEEVRKIFFKNYPMAALWLDKQVARAKEFHAVKTWMGRIRRLPEIASDDHKVKAEAERQAKNAPIQALASDMNNHFMVMNLRLARKHKIKCYPMATVHDANFLQVKETQVNKLIKIMKYVVQNTFPDFRCKMVLDFEVGKTLGTLKAME